MTMAITTIRIDYSTLPEGFDLSLVGCNHFSISGALFYRAGLPALKTHAVLGQDSQLVGDLVRRADEVGLVGILRGHPQGLALARAADHHGDAPDRRRRVDGVADGIPSPL